MCDTLLQCLCQSMTESCCDSCAQLCLPATLSLSFMLGLLRGEPAAKMHTTASDCLAHLSCLRVPAFACTCLPPIQSVRATLPTDDVSQVTGMSSGRGESAALSVVARATDEEGTHRELGPLLETLLETPLGLWYGCAAAIVSVVFVLGLMAIDTVVRNAATLTHSGTHVGVYTNNDYVPGLQDPGEYVSMAAQLTTAITSMGTASHLGVNRSTNGSHLHCCSVCRRQGAVRV